MRELWEQRMLSEDLHIRSCEARVSAEEKGGHKCVAFRIANDGLCS